MEVVFEELPLFEEWRTIFDGDKAIMDAEDPLAAPLKPESGETEAAEEDEDGGENAKYWQEVNRSLCEQSEWWEMADDTDHDRWEREELCCYTHAGLEIEVLQQGWRGIAFRVWEAALALCDFMIAHPTIVQGKKVLDLGSGPGLTGLVAAGLGAARVIITDLPEVTELIALNVERYKKTRRSSSIIEESGGAMTEVVAQSYDWSESASSQDIPADNELFIFSECLYFEDLFSMLHGALLQVVPVGGSVLFSYRLRIARREKPYFEALERDFDLRVMPAPKATGETVLEPDMQAYQPQSRQAAPEGSARGSGEVVSSSSRVLHGPSSQDATNQVGVFICLARRRGGGGPG